MGIGRGLFDFTDKKSFMYQAAEQLIELLVDRDFNDWNTSHSNEMPQLPWSCIAALQALTTKLATFSRNMRNLSLLDPDHSVTTAPRDLDIDEVKKGVRTFARFIEKLKGHVEDGTIYTGVDASITPSNKNPEVLKYKAIMNELGSSSRQHAGDKSKVLSPPSSPSKGSRRQVAQSPEKKKRATSRVVEAEIVLVKPVVQTLQRRRSRKGSSALPRVKTQPHLCEESLSRRNHVPSSWDKVLSAPTQPRSAYMSTTPTSAPLTRMIERNS